MSIYEESLRSQKGIWKDILGNPSELALPFQNPKRIVLFGIGSSFHAAKLTSYVFNRFKSSVRCPVFAFPSQAVGVEFIPQKGDWAFGFSHRGKTPHTVSALQKFRSAGALPILVAGQQAESLDPIDSILRTTPPERCEPHSYSVTGAICALTSLILGPEISKEWEKLAGESDPDLEECKKQAGKGPKLVLGEWEGEWVAREGALKLMEVAKIPVRAFGTEEYFHGPRLSVQTSDSIWWVKGTNDDRAKKLNTLKIEMKDDSPLGWVNSLVQLQWLSLATAINLGVNPDAQE
jgi:fructoselysine-6-P-deglycase FrlB-like protein